MLSQSAQEYVALQTGTSAPGYVVHLFNYCECYHENPDDPLSTMKFRCPNSPSMSFFFNFQKILGLPDQILYDQSSARSQSLAKFDSTLMRFQRISLLYTYLTIMMVLSRISVVSLIVPLRLLQMRLPYTGGSSIQGKFIMLRGIFTFSYILTFVTANLLSAVAYLHYKEYFFKGIYDQGDHSGIEYTLSNTTIAYNVLIFLFSYIELYPAITYMSQRPKTKKRLYDDDLDDLESHPLELLYPQENTLSTQVTMVRSNSSEHHKIKSEDPFSDSNATSSLMTSTTRIDSDNFSIGSFDTSTSLTPSSVVSALPSLQASSYGPHYESDIISEVSTTNQYGEYNTPSGSAAPSIRSVSTQRDPVVGSRH